MDECRKRQVERRGDETLHRCIHKQADTYRQPVDNDVCSACPLRVYALNAKPRQPMTNALPVVDTSNYPTCEFRVGTRPNKTCGVTGLPVSEEICNRCVKETKDATPNLMDKVVNYAAAVRKWVAAGRPERTDEECEQIYNDHCSKCSMYDKVKKICNSCGCPANTDQPALRNKLKMGTEECPLGRFPAKVKSNA